MESHTTREQQDTETQQANRKCLRVLLALGCAIAASLHGAHAATITFASSAGETHFQSDGTTPIPADSGFYFELGSFAGGFIPTTANTDQWLANWSPVTDPGGTPLPEATTEFTSIPFFLGSFDGYVSQVTLEHNNAPFPANSQGYVWGYDNRTEEGDAQWILLTNSTTWRYPDVSGLGFSATWDVAGANPAETVAGTLTGGGSTPISMTLGNITIPPGVPEPSTAALSLTALALLSSRRRRPTKKTAHPHPNRCTNHVYSQHSPHHSRWR